MDVSVSQGQRAIHLRKFFPRAVPWQWQEQTRFCWLYVEFARDLEGLQLVSNDIGSPRVVGCGVWDQDNE